MRIVRSNKLKPVTADASKRTTYYKTSLPDMIRSLESENGNVWVIGALEKDKWDALDLENNLFGSRILDDVLYICETDGHDILVAGQLVDPENALDTCSIDELSAYIQDATDEVITRNISGYEIKLVDIDTIAENLLQSGYHFTDLVRDFEDINNNETI